MRAFPVKRKVVGVGAAALVLRLFLITQHCRGQRSKAVLGRIHVGHGPEVPQTRTHFFQPGGGCRSGRHGGGRGHLRERLCACGESGGRCRTGHLGGDADHLVGAHLRSKAGVAHTCGSVGRQPQRSDGVLRLCRLGRCQFRRNRAGRCRGHSRFSGAHQTCPKPCTTVRAKPGHQTFLQAARSCRIAAAHNHGRHGCTNAGSCQACTNHHREDALQEPGFGQPGLRIDGECSTSGLCKRLQPSNFLRGHVDKHGVWASTFRGKVLCSGLKAHVRLTEWGLIESTMGGLTGQSRQPGYKVCRQDD